MALLWVDGFEQYGAQGGLVTPNTCIYAKYSALDAASINVVAGRNSGDAITLPQGSGLFTPALTTNGTLIAGVAFKTNNTTGNKCIMDFAAAPFDGDPVSYGQMGVWSQTQNLAIRLGNSTLNTVNVALSTNTWYYLEFKVFSNDSTGTAEVKLDGVSVLTYSGDTKYYSASYEQYVAVNLRGTNGLVLTFDDFYVCDASGSTCNDFLGDCTVYTLLPDGDASGNMTANSGSDEYAMVNGTTLNTTNYIKDTATGNRCVFTYSDLPITPNTVYGVMAVAECNLSSNLAKGLKTVTQNGSGSVNTASAGQSVTRATTYLGAITDVYEKNADNAAWTPALINDARFGVEVV